MNTSRLQGLESFWGGRKVAVRILIVMLVGILYTSIIIALSLYLADAATFSNHFTPILVGTLIAIVVSFWVLIFGRSITAPMEKSATLIEDLASGQVVLSVVERERLKSQANLANETGQIYKACASMIEYLNQTSGYVEKLTDGNLSIDVTPMSANDSLGNHLKQMVENFRTIIKMIVDSTANLTAAASQLTITADQSEQATGQIATTMQQIAKGAQQQANSINQTAILIESINHSIDQVAKGAQDQAAAIRETSSAAKQIVDTLQDVTANTNAVTANSQGTAVLARQGAQTVQGTILGMDAIHTKVGISAEKVKEMGARSEEIGQIVDTIEDIASQTNLLALNAAIEAARAGEHGKGFAIVADEVRKLAERSSLATKEISTLIRTIHQAITESVKAMEESAREVEKGVSLSKQSGMALDAILDGTEKVIDSAQHTVAAVEQMKNAANRLERSMESVSMVIEQNSAVTAQMSGGSQEITRAVENIASISQENSAAVEEVSASTEEVSAQVNEVTQSANQLSEMASRMQQVISKFTLEDTAGKIARGSGLLIRTNFVKEKYGQVAFEKVLRLIDDPEIVRTFRGTIDPEGMYPRAYSQKLTKAIRDALDNGGFGILRPMATASAKYDLKNSLAHYTRPNDPTYSLERIDLILRYYYGEVKFDVASLGNHHYRIRMYKVDRLKEDTCSYTIVGYLEGVIIFCGGNNPVVEHSQCAQKGSPYCEYNVRWS